MPKLKQQVSLLILLHIAIQHRIKQENLMLKYFKVPYIQQTHFMQFLLKKKKHQPHTLLDMLELHSNLLWL